MAAGLMAIFTEAPSLITMNNIQIPYDQQQTCVNWNRSHHGPPDVPPPPLQTGSTAAGQGAPNAAQKLSLLFSWIMLLLAIATTTVLLSSS